MTNKQFTVQIPWVPASLATMWHPTDRTGPFAVLSRGAFADEVSAILWAQLHLNGTPYRVVRIGE